MRKPATAVIALSLFVLPTVGCGDTVDKNAYIKSVSAVQAKTSADAKKLSDEMATAKTPAAIADKLTELGEAVTADADDLAKIEAPDEVTTDHANYVKLIREFGGQLEDLAPKVKKATPTTVGSVLQQASGYTTTLSTQESKIIASINSKLQS